MSGNATKQMPLPEFKRGLMSIARSEPEAANVSAAWRLVFAYMDADEAAQRDCSDMLRADLDTQKQETG